MAELPPHLVVLEEGIRARASERDAELQKRLSEAKGTSLRHGVVDELVTLAVKETITNAKAVRIAVRVVIFRMAANSVKDLRTDARRAEITPSLCGNA